MDRNHDHDLKALIEELINAYRWGDKLDAINVNASWENVVGKIFAKHTTHLYVKNRVLYASLDSSALRNELHMERTKIRDMINKDLGKKVIDKIVLK